MHCLPEFNAVVDEYCDHGSQRSGYHGDCRDIFHCVTPVPASAALRPAALAQIACLALMIGLTRKEPGMLRLSVLDQSTVVTGRSPDTSIRESIRLAQHCEALGYVRYWCAEHHNSDSQAAPRPRS